MNYKSEMALNQRLDWSRCKRSKMRDRLDKNEALFTAELECVKCSSKLRRQALSSVARKKMNFEAARARMKVRDWFTSPFYL